MIHKNICPLCEAPDPRPEIDAYLWNDKREIAHCKGCQSSFFWPLPSEEELKVYYEGYFESFFPNVWKDYHKGRFIARELTKLKPPLHGKLKSPLHYKEKGRFLDVGCALGWMLKGVREASGWEVFGLEADSQAAQYARNVHRIEVHEGNVKDAGWPGDFFDYIFMNNVLEHTPNPRGLLKEISRLLKPSGRLFITTPNGAFDLMPNRILYAKEKLALRIKHAGHLFFFSREALRKLFERAGLNLLRWRCFHWKVAMKAAGWIPGSLARFKREHTPQERETGDGRPFAELTAPGAPEALNRRETKKEETANTQELPKPKPAFYYFLRNGMKEMFKGPGSWPGADFEILLEKPWTKGS